MPRLENRTWSCSCAARGRHKSPLGDTAAGLAAKVGEMLSSSVSSSSLARVAHGARDPGTSASVATTTSSSSRTLNLRQHLVQRSLVLFAVGAFMALVLNLLQVQRNVTLFPDEVMATLFSSAWWVPPCCGTAAGEPSPAVPARCSFARAATHARGDRVRTRVAPGLVQQRGRLWRFLGGIVLNIFSQKLDFANNVQLSLTLAALSLGLWWTFDRSRSGLGLGITIAFVATLITQFLVYNGVYQYTSPDFLYIRSWLPCIFFSGGVTVGNIGRQLAMVI
ncbi:INSI1 protein, partial [Crypturellus undulatus]|nr:INSI1 protein [Crypturellus undulatus]